MDALESIAMSHDLKKFVATCARGIEPLLFEELISLGAERPSRSRGAALFEGTLETAYRACLWSRLAGRILYPIAEFPAPDEEALYRGGYALDWPAHFSADSTFSVACVSDGSPIANSHYAALRLKDAVADRFRDLFNRRPSIRLERPDVKIRLYLNGNSAQVALDLSGESLHRRGYRRAGGEAPLKENLAAALLGLAGWSTEASPDSALLDPLCGSGTLLIEAALIYGDMAPGLGRDYFGFLGWRLHDRRLWEELLGEARDRRLRGMERSWPKIVGYDASRSAIREAVENVEAAGLSGLVHVERRDLARLDDPSVRKGWKEGLSGLIVANPPYGERMGSRQSLRFLYRCLGRKIRDAFPGWRAGVLTAHRELAAELALGPSERRRLFNGPLPCEFRIFEVKPSPSRLSEAVWKGPRQPTSAGSEDLANRLHKNLKRLKKWAEGQGVSCYRVYDGDIPEYNVVIDRYERWLHVQEYAPPKTIDPERAAERLKQAVRTVEAVFAAPREDLFVKVRHKQKGKSQYQKRGGRGRLFEVREKNCRLLVNLSDYLDTGLFLDHRTTREWIQEAAKGGRFLNLFGHTGSATVHAARGGAKTSTTVDASSVYLEWARNNLALNGFSEENHRFVQADCLEWLSRTREQFDLIFLDPPTFSNSRGQQRVFDVQRDHPALIRSAMKRLEHDGTLLFSTNFRKFRLDPDLGAEFQAEEITRETIPFDFARSPRIHRCWRFRRTN